MDLLEGFKQEQAQGLAQLPPASAPQPELICFAAPTIPPYAGWIIGIIVALLTGLVIGLLIARRRNETVRSRNAPGDAQP